MRRRASIPPITVTAFKTTAPPTRPNIHFWMSAFVSAKASLKLDSTAANSLFVAHAAMLVFER